MPVLTADNPHETESPLRGEPFSAEHIWNHAQILAARQAVTATPGDRRFVDRFEDNCDFIEATYRAVTNSVRAGQPISPDAEWLVDNYYVVKEQLREIREDLPRGFYRELPKLTTPPWVGFPRVYELALELVVHTDSSLDGELIAGFVTSYQQTTPLTSGEIWAVPIMLRLVLVENLRRLCGHMITTLESRQRAKKILANWQKDNTQPIVLGSGDGCSTIVMELIESLRIPSPDYNSPSMHELAERLHQSQEMLDECVRTEQQRLASNQVSIGNLITSMRLLTALDWSLFFERVSLVEKFLREDPAGVYPKMDFATRDHYRHAIEKIAKRTDLGETQVSAALLRFARESAANGDADPRAKHVGFYLVDAGRQAFERLLNYRPKVGERLERAAKHHATSFYLGGVALFTALSVAGVVALSRTYGGSGALCTILGLLAVLPASELAVGLINFIITSTLRPQLLPRMDFSERIPEACHTLVVMPTLLTNAAGVRSILERLEIHYLANPEAGLTFAILTDFTDAPQQTMPEDESFVTAAQAGIATLNKQHGTGENPKFLMLHRARKWNPVEGVWMGWERKRGKLLELNKLLRGAKDTSYEEKDIPFELLQTVKFVITLDSDTRLPHAAARRLIGSLAHPLNRPHFDSKVHRVVHGYGVLQPRVSVSLASANRSLFARIFSNSGGLDPYCSAVSDVYQDLFGEGSYAGKGIYDVDAFSAAADHAFPENHILSHDLIEGGFARVGLVTDVELFDEYPTRLSMDAERQHRWVRGDWQLLPWLERFVPTPEGRRRNPLTLLSRWKVADNLRRSLVPLSLVALLLAGWFAGGPIAWITTAAAALVLASPLVLSVLSTLRAWPRGDSWRQQLQDALTSLGRTAIQCALNISFLPFKAKYMTDAVVRTLHRLFISRRRLLEWETADATERRLKRESRSPFHTMGWISAASLLIAFALRTDALTAAMSVLLLWFFSPALAFVTGRPAVKEPEPLTDEDRLSLRRIARNTWAFFEGFVGPDDNWLPPDNVQEFPKLKVARRISPTNEGLYILSAVAASDFGYIGKMDLVALLEKNLNAWQTLSQYRGHFYNWYNTATLTPLSPRYVSTADSGNLAACLLTAHQSLLDVLDEPLLNRSFNDGVWDSVRLVEESLARLQPRGARFVSTEQDILEQQLVGIRHLAETNPTDLRHWQRLLQDLRAAAKELPKVLKNFEQSLGLNAAELSMKVQFLCQNIEGRCQDVDSFMPWLPSLSLNEPFASSRLPCWSELIAELEKPLGINQAVALQDRLAHHLRAVRESLQVGSVPRDEANRLGIWLDDFSANVAAGMQHASACHGRYHELANHYLSITMEMDFTFLYNSQRRLFSVGYNLEDGQSDRSHYDMLASESRIASIVAIAKGDTDHRHWFQLGRALTQTESGKGLLSWGGTMFEYLMPTLFMRDVQGSLLDQSNRAAVERQIAYGKQRHVPWGISESAFAAVAANSDYHYQSFGVPGLGLKQGLGKDLVVSPYSTALAAEIDPAAAVANFHALANDGADGPWGFYDAIDYTPDRVPPGERRAVVFTYMAHHQGMTLVALDNCLFQNRMQRRFQRQPLARATELLLQERIPQSVLQFQPSDDGTVPTPLLPTVPGPVSRRISTPNTTVPRVHLLSNGQYTVMCTNSGGGYSSCRGMAVTRWRPDTTRDDWGQFIYLRDVASGKRWSAGHQPLQTPPDEYEVTYSVDKAEFRRLDGNLETHLEISVAPENNADVRQIKITNHGKRAATIEVTSYSEVVLSPASTDLAHPAFNKLFVETEFIPDYYALLAKRRPREAASPPAWALHVLAAMPPALERVEYETDRARFLGRGRTPDNPAAMDRGVKLSGTTGSVLDPVFSLRTRMTILPDESATLAFVTAFAESREEALQLADQYRDPRVVQRAFEMAWAHSQVELRHLHISPSSLQLYQRLVSSLIYPNPTFRAPESVLKANRRGQRALWRHGISGDNPIVLLRVSQPDHRSLLRELLLAHEFWNSHGLTIDFVVLNEHPAGYFDEFQQQLQELIQTTARLPLRNSGGIFPLRASQLDADDLILLQSVAALNFHGDRGTLFRQVESAAAALRPVPPALQPIRAATTVSPSIAHHPLENAPDLSFENGLGGFTANGDYSLRLRADQTSPTPWSNIVANPQFGFLVTESGGGYTWAGNSRENKLTSWCNDPITDAPPEILYLRDEESGEIWTPTPMPLRDSAEYGIEHRRGSTQFTHRSREIASELLLSIAPDACVKFASLRLRNESNRPRTLSATYFAEWVLGVSRPVTQMFVATSRDPDCGALLAQNNYHEDYPNQVALLHILGGADSVTGDRTEFIGRNGNSDNPAALKHIELSGTTGSGLDPCGAVQKKITLAPGQETELIFLLGWGENAQATTELLAAFQSPTQVHAAIEQTARFWEETLTSIEVETPNRELNTLVNEWLLYQTLSCRVWGRSAFYQSGGAFGFRDQLQDSMALVYSRPDITRQVILQAAAHQFEEGDVQHWWHPPSGRGVRTRFADDYLWLPFVTSFYVSTTADTEILDEQVNYLRSHLLEDGEVERYELPEKSSLSEKLYHHCLRAIDHGFRFGAHGLPLMGCGDWNDGMNKVGAGGQGESVWMGWFLRTVLLQFVPLVEARGDTARAAAYGEQAERLLRAVEEHAWDGQWYRRAFFDDGTPLGSRQSDECQIDSLAQTWSVIAGGDAKRSEQAMRSLEELLLRPDDRLVLLLAPPFDKTPLDPGYIKGYPPGIRENGGQYTHAATWVIQALTLQGKGTRAVEVFDLINPILAATANRVEETYHVEPYVVAADVYGTAPHAGRGGWTWYTGSSAWLYRVAIESILGLKLRGDRLLINPCISRHWPECAINYRHGKTTWHILIKNPQRIESGVETLLVDGNTIPAEQGVHLIDDGGDHHVEVCLGPPNRDSSKTVVQTPTLVNRLPTNGTASVRQSTVK